MTEALQSLLTSPIPHAATAVLLFLLPFFREDLAIVIGAFLVVERGLPFALAPGSLHVGIIASDFAQPGPAPAAAAPAGAAGCGRSARR